MNITSLFLDAALKYPEKTAIIEDGRQITFGQLAADVQRTAAYFRSKGIGKGDRVLVFVPMGIDLYRIVLALFYCGATAVFLDEWVSRKRMELCCEIADCKGFIGIFKARVFALFSRELRRIPVKLRLRGMEKSSAAIEDLSEDDPALITFTTGSTGRPKAANRTHGFLRAQFDALIDEIDPKPTDIDMPALPIVLFMNLGVGCTSVIAKFKMSKPEKMDHETIVGQLIENKVSRIIASPFFVLRLAQHCQQHNISLPALEKIFTGGAPVFPTDAEMLRAGFPEAQINIVYGSTEVEPISKISTSELLLNRDSTMRGLPVGTIYRNANVKIIGIVDGFIADQTEDGFNSLILNEGQIGEIVVSGPHVLKNYYNSEEAFRLNKIVVDETIWHRTGDSGYLSDGELFLTGRCSQLIRTNEDYLSTFIVENQLAQKDGITAGTLISIDGTLVLCVESALPLEAVEKRTSDIVRDRIIVLKHIPRDPRHNSKIDYGRLREVIV